MKLSDQKIWELSTSYKTPLYIYDGDFLENHVNRIRQYLHPSIDIFFSLKANNNLFLAHCFLKKGFGAEVASKGELFLAKTAGFLPSNIIFSGPGKNVDEITYALEQNIYCVIIESYQELVIIEQLAQKMGMIANIAVRINPDSDLVQSSIKMAGVPRQFGIDESQLVDVFEKINSSSFLHFRGIHIYTGTQILQAQQLYQAFSYAVNLARCIRDEYGLLCEMIDMGGGMGVPYFAHEKELDFLTLAKRVNQLINKAVYDFPTTRFIIESGRYLTAETGVYVARVLYVKHSKGETFYIVDGGMHHHVSSTFRGRTLRNNFPIKLISKSMEDCVPTPIQKATIVGPLCTPEDCLAKNVELPVAKEGDLIMIKKSGAYGLSYSPQLFLGHESAMEVYYYQGESRVIRERGRVEDLLLHQVLTKLK
ncbi:type III PLP-dependent enzyme [Paenibacillus tyrfis]|uniref:type III PLP-dependent enzyme n=1 Tax=Paenibacillus tyrfis TaxID=1501230 RepID=UPI00209F371B|nr:type III PLP-dependent enzyme [Paenibacillus tyrfis]MCP1311560.1 type III PLP-dependent enzyme [Paenibacillus tyrfis]